MPIRVVEKYEDIQVDSTVLYRVCGVGDEITATVMTEGYFQGGHNGHTVRHEDGICRGSSFLMNYEDYILTLKPDEAWLAWKGENCFYGQDDPGFFERVWDAAREHYKPVADTLEKQLALAVLEAEENANTPNPRVSVLRAIEKRLAELVK